MHQELSLRRESRITPPPNSLCIKRAKSTKTNIPRAPLRSYKERPRHLCKVTRTLLPRAQSG